MWILFITCRPSYGYKTWRGFYLLQGVDFFNLQTYFNSIRSVPCLRTQKKGNKKCFITVIYRSPTQSLEDFEKFKNGWENTILNINNSNPYLTIFICDFNARNTFWCDSDIINTEGLDLSELSSHRNLHQLINTPTHILPNSESCIYLLFTSQHI